MSVEEVAVDLDDTRRGVVGMAAVGEEETSRSRDGQ